MEWHLVKADKKRKKWQIRGELWNGIVVKLPGHREEYIAEKMMRNIESLNRSRMFDELPDKKLAGWIEGLPVAEAERYVRLGLLDLRFLDKRRPLEDLLAEFLAHKRANNDNDSSVPKEVVAKVRRIFAAIGPEATLISLNQDNVITAIKTLNALRGRRKGLPVSQKTFAQYVFAIKEFCDWMVDERGATSNPLRKLKAPAARGAPVRNRRPMPVADFKKLVLSQA